jgi:hypothetical protein
MPRKRKQPSIEEQLRAVIAQATEEGRYDLAKKLIDFLAPKVLEVQTPQGISVSISKEEA